MNISYDWYKIFFWAAECNSITLAAEKLYISQPAVSQCIRQLEEAIGCPLFIRTPKGVKLTAEGKTLYAHVSDGVNAFSEGERRLTAMLRLDAGEIRIGASDMTLEFCLLAYLERFHKKYPNIKISITNNPTPQTLELLRHGKIDFAVVSEPFACEGFEAVPVREIQDIFICKSTCDIANHVSISEFQEQFIMLERNTSTRTFLEKELRGLYGPDGYAEYYYMPALDILSDSRLAFENLAHAYTPDHIVYCGARPLYLENNDNVAGDFKDYVDRQGRPPKIVVINSGAFYALGSNVKAVRLAAQLFADQVRLLYYTHNFGGPNPLPEEFVRFIENWEIESYRSKVSTGV